MTLHLLAPAKLNLTLEVIRKREDGYHEIASIMQTIDLADRLTISDAPDLQLVVSGPEAHGAPEYPELNLAYRAAIALQQTAGVSNLGARIELEKRIPAGAGLGGGSSDAAAVLRGLNRLWRLDLPLAHLEAITSTLGSDVTFFLHGGTALSTGRGEIIEPLPESAPQQFTLFASTEDLPEKTHSMYGALSPADFSDGSKTTKAAEDLRTGTALPAAQMCNAFDRAVAEIAPRVGVAIAVCRDAGLPVLAAGAGPSFFSPTYLGLIHSSLLSVLESDYGVTARACRTLTAADALAVREA